MKHVFIIHSHTSFLSSMGTIDYLALNMQDVIFLYARNYSNSIFRLECRVININEMYSAIKNVGWKIFKKKKVRSSWIDNIDKFIDTNIRDNYTLYLPYIGFPLFQLFYTNTMCVKMCYVQEGGIPFKNAYSTDYPFFKKLKYNFYNRFILREKRLFMPPKWYLEEIFTKQNTIESYAINNSFFKNLPSHNNIIKWPKKKLDFEFQNDYPIFVFDGFVANEHIESSFYLEKCKKIINLEAKENNYIKFHPAQSQYEQEQITSFFDILNKKYIILSNNIPFELILSSYSGLTIIGFGSSLLHFAEDLHHTVKNYEEWLYSSPLFSYYKNIQ